MTPEEQSCWDKLAAENAAMRTRDQQLQRALAFWHPGVRVDDVPEAATKRAADDACLLFGLEEADEQSAADLGWVAWVVPGEFARLRSRLAEAERKYEERVQQHEEYIAFADEEITGLIEAKRKVLARLAQAEAVLREFQTRDWHRGMLTLDSEDRIRIDAFLTADSASAAPVVHRCQPFKDIESETTMTDGALEFLRRAADGKHRIVSSGDLHQMQIAEARAEGRFYVEPGGGLGWALLPWKLTTAKDEQRKLRAASQPTAALRPGSNPPPPTGAVKPPPPPNPPPAPADDLRASLHARTIVAEALVLGVGRKTKGNE